MALAMYASLYDMPQCRFHSGRSKTNLKRFERLEISEIEKAQILRLTEGYSCSDLNSVVKEAAMGPVRELTTEQLM